MALFINVDPVAPRWWKRKVYRGWQFGYSGGTENDFMIDIEVAKWRFACYIGMKKVQNYAPGYEKHLKWRKEQQLARERAYKPESIWTELSRRWRNKTAANRVDKKHAGVHHASAVPGLVLAAIRKLRQRLTAHHDHHKDRLKLATRDGLPEPISGDAAAPFKGVILYEQHQGKTPDHAHNPNSKTGELPEGAD